MSLMSFLFEVSLLPSEPYHTLLRLKQDLIIKTKLFSSSLQHSLVALLSDNDYQYHLKIILLYYKIIFNTNFSQKKYRPILGDIENLYHQFIYRLLLLIHQFVS